MPFKIIRNDITKVNVDAIVNSANPDGKLNVGEAAITPAFHLHAKYVIHTVGPEWQRKKHGLDKKLRLCYKNCLKLASDYKCKSIAFPLISTGTYNFPKSDALEIALSVISDFLSEEDMMIYLVVFDRESFVLSEKLFKDVESYIDDHYVEEKILKSAEPLPMMASFPSASPYISADLEEEKVFAERSLDDIVLQLGETFQQRLFRLIDERKLTDVQVYKKANLDRKLFSKIRCNVDYRPKKITVVALAIALELNIDETKDLLTRAELALSPSNKFDLIVTFFIERKVYDIYTINIALFQYDQPLLGE